MKLCQEHNIKNPEYIENLKKSAYSFEHFSTYVPIRYQTVCPKCQGKVMHNNDDGSSWSCNCGYTSQMERMDRYSRQAMQGITVKLNKPFLIIDPPIV